MMETVCANWFSKETQEQAWQTSGITSSVSRSVNNWQRGPVKKGAAHMKHQKKHRKVNSTIGNEDKLKTSIFGVILL